MDKIAQKAKFMDMYASRPILSFGKDGKIYSCFGLLLTFLTLIIIGGMAIWLGISIFGRRKLSFIQYELPPSTYNPKIPFSPDDFKIGLALLGYDDRTMIIYDTDLFLPDGTSFPVLQNQECKFHNFPEKTFTCFKEWEPARGKTFLDVRNFYGFNIGYSVCESLNCQDATTTRLLLGNKTVKAAIVYEDFLIDPFNYDTPIKAIESDTYPIVWLDIGTTLVIELNEIEFISDDGWIFENLKTEKKLKPTASLTVSGQDMLLVSITYGGKKTVYKRTYPKIPDFLAQISGFITIITPVFFILASQYGNLQAVQHMINEVYEIKLNKHNSAAAAPKKLKRSSKLKYNPLSAKATEQNLLPQKTKVKVKSKSGVHLPPLQTKPKSKSTVPFAPHAAFVMGGLGKLPTKEDTPPIPEEDPKAFRFDSLDKSPSSPFRFSSLKAQDQDESQLISRQKILLEHEKPCPPEEHGRLNKKLELMKPKDEVESQNPESESEEEEEEEGVPLRSSDPLEVPWQDWLRSFWKPSPEVQVLKKAKEHIMETFDLVTLSKKVNEIDKLKACLLTQDQRVIFENLPSSIIVLNPEIDVGSPEAVKQYHWKDSFKGDETALRQAYSKLKETKSELDKLLLRLYESEYIYDGLSS